jgi:hypothetical protein
MSRRIAPLAAFLTVACGVLLAVGALNYRVDPFGVYRKDNACLSAPCVPWDYLDYLVATYLPADAAIVGSSLTLNSDLKRSAAAAGERLINLSGLGNTGPQQEVMLERAIERQHVKTVYWEVYTNVTRKKQPFTPNFPRFAYDQSLLNDYPYLLSIETLISSLETVIGERRPRFDPDDLQSYHDCTYCQPGIASVKAALPGMLTAFDLYLDVNSWGPAAVRTALAEDILPVVRRHPEMRFVFFFPPISIFMTLELDRRLQAIGHSFVETKRTLADALLELPNVTVADLQDVPEVVTDFSRYYDIMHYDPDVNVWIIEQLRSGNRRVDRSNLDRALASLANLVEGRRAAYEVFRAEALAAR